MIYFAWFIFAFSLLQFFVAVTNLFFIQRFAKNSNKSNPLISVLIPARNEEQNIETILTDLQNQSNENLEIIVFNDQSEDKTAEVVNARAKHDKRIKLINSSGLPAGWLGKNHACYSLAKQARGKYLLFIDADVRIFNDIISETTHFVEKHNLGMLSIFPTQIMKSSGEWTTVPVMNYILLSLLPLILVRKTNFPSLAAANGQFMFFDSEIYKEKQPHEKMKSSKVEDIQIARYFKERKRKIACLSGKDDIRCRMYNGFGEAVNGFSKNVTMFFGNSFSMAILFWLITTFGFVAILLYLPPILLYIYLLIVVLTRVIISATSRQNILKNILYFIPQQLALGMFILKAIDNKFSKKFQWKGRTISS